jgi:trk system potassium uptake protein TrkH
MREKDLLRKSYTTVVYYCAIMVMVVGVSLLLPLVILPFYPQELKTAPWFIYPALFSFASSAFVLWRLKWRKDWSLSMSHSSVIIVFAWAYGCLAGALPFVLSGQYGFLQGLFESVAGWTGSGLTVTNTDTVSHTILLWRSLTQYLGGAGFALIMITIMTGPAAMNIMNAEGHPHELLPHVKSSAMLVMKIYLFYLGVGSIALTVAGMPFFDSVNHTMTGLGTGGFSTRNASIGYYNSPSIEIVVMLIMLIGHTSFTIHHFVFQGKWKLLPRLAEVKMSFLALTVLTVLTVLTTTLPLYGGGPGGLFTAIRRGAFETISSMTGTGFSTVNYSAWPAIGIFLNVMAMMGGGHTNSTSGALKMLRVYLVFKAIYWMIRDQFLPRKAVNLHYYYRSEERTYINPRHLQELFTFVAIYFLSLALGIGILLAAGYPMPQAVFEFASAQGCVGQSIGVTSYNAPPMVLWTLIYGMFFGRLEFFVIFYCIIKIFRDVRIYTSDKV